MPVRFKFRSSVGYDTVEINGQSSISVRDLRIKIVEQTKLKICNDFELVISDAETGNTFNNEDSMVADGTNVIIKRVPAGRSAALDLPHVNSTENMVLKGSDFIYAKGSSRTTDVDMDNFDDFGVDLCPAPEACSSDLDPGVNMMNYTEKSNDVRCSELSISRSQNIEPSVGIEGVSRGNPKDYDINSGAGGELQLRLQHKMEDKKLIDGNTSTPIPNAEVPAELGCPLCNAIFKEAVMIPCCQHSFCNKCVRSVLAEKKKCPKCSSTKCRVDDLLPNVSLRQAIEHFLESQVLMSGSDNILPKYAPDGESGIQAKDQSCAMSILQREPQLLHSPSATGKGSNQVTPESAYESGARNFALAAGNGSRLIRLSSGKSVKSTHSSHNIKLIETGDEKDFTACDEGLRPAADFQGEANSASSKKKGLWLNTADASGSFVPMNRSKKGDRHCYMCGSPDHLVRECPAASNPYPMLHTDGIFPGGMSAYGPPYWQGPPLHHIRPFTNLYGNPAMMPFDPTMVPLSPFGVPPYMMSMYAGTSVPCRFMRMGGMMPHPVIASVERPLSHAEFMELQEKERRHKISNECAQREQVHDCCGDSLECYRHDEPRRRSLDSRAQYDREIVRSDSDNSENWRSQKKHLHRKWSDSFSHKRSGFVLGDEDTHSIECKHDKGSHFSASGRESSWAYYSERSNIEAQEMSGSSNHHSRDWHKQRRSGSLKKGDTHNEKCGSESSWRSHRNRKAVSDEREETDVKKHSRKHSSHSAAGLSAHSSSGDQKRHRKEGVSHHNSKHTKRKEEKVDDDLENDRWKLVDGLDEEQLDYHYHKRKRNR